MVPGRMHSIVKAVPCFTSAQGVYGVLSCDAGVWLRLSNAWCDMCAACERPEVVLVWWAATPAADLPIRPPRQPACRSLGHSPQPATTPTLPAGPGAEPETTQWYGCVKHRLVTPHAPARTVELFSAHAYLPYAIAERLPRSIFLDDLATRDQVCLGSA